MILFANEVSAHERQIARRERTQMIKHGRCVCGAPLGSHRHCFMDLRFMNDAEAFDMLFTWEANHAGLEDFQKAEKPDVA